MTEYETRVTALIVLPKGDETFSEFATHVRLADQAAGEYVEVEQIARDDLGKIAINPEEWPTLRAAIDRMIGECRKGSDDAHN